MKRLRTQTLQRTILLSFISVIAISLLIYTIFKPITFSYYINLNGDDKNSGSKDAPLKSLEGFKQALIKDINEDKITKGNVKIYIDDGIYTLENSFSLSKNDFKGKDISLEFIGDDKNDVRVTGGVQLNYKNFSSKLFSSTYTYDLSEIDLDHSSNDGDKTAPQLYFKEKPMTLALYPSEDGYFIDFKTNKLYFVPPSSIKTDDIYLSLLKVPLINLKDCENISFKDITFECTRDMVIKASNCSNLNFYNCIIRNSSKTGFYFDNVSNSSIKKCDILNLGDGELYVNGGKNNNFK
ncbi:MAG: right-handed parallel beta-helix repeat-containing protein [Clostridium sp.]